MTQSSPYPLVSVVVPSLNQARFLDDCLKSLEQQDYPNLEVLLIDGGSEDDSLRIIRRWEPYLAYWVSEPDRGQADAINKGLTRARGDIVSWLNSDDLLLPGAVSAAVQALEANPEAVMVYADGVLIDEHSRLLDWHRYRQFGLLDLLCFEVLLQPTAFMRRCALERVGLLRPDFRLILDHELWIRLAAHGPLHHVAAYWAAERTHAEAKTVAAAAQFAEEARRLIGEARESAVLGPVIASHDRVVSAGLECFAGRRMIDAGQYGLALGCFGRGLKLSPRFTLRYWYKILQALMGAIGLQRAFLWYRETRRSLQHGRTRLRVENGRLSLERMSGR